MRSLPAALAAVLLLAACPATPPKPVEKGSAVALPTPVLALVPPRATYLIAARRLATFAEALRAAIEPLRILDQRMTAERVDGDLRRDLGASPLAVSDLDEAGLDASGDAALFGVGYSPTFVLKVADEARLKKFLADRTKQVTTYLRSYKGQTVTSWNHRPLSGPIG